MKLIKLIFAMSVGVFVSWTITSCENQDNEFYWQPFEVRKEECEKTIIVTNWVKVNKDNKDED